MDSPVLFLITGCSLLICSHAASPNPGLQAQITSKAFNYADQVAMNELAKKIQTLKIPDQHGSSGAVKYDLSSIHVTSFTKPSSGINVLSNGLQWWATGTGIKMSAHWHYKLRKFLPISDSGSLDVSISGLSFKILISLGKDKNGRPSISSPSCSCDPGSVSVKFHGGASWIYNLFKGKVADMIKDQLRKLMCKEAQNAVNTDAEKSLQKLPMTAELDHRFILDYSLLSPPLFKSSAYMQTEHKGEVTWKNDATPIPGAAPALAGNITSGKMFYIWMSDYVVNSACYSANKHGFLKYNLTAKDLPAKERGVLNTTCSTVCIGKLIPQIAKKFPNSVVSLGMHSTKAPTASITNGKITLDFAGTVYFYADKNKIQNLLFSFDMNLSAGASVTLKDEKIYGKLGSLSPKVGKVTSNIGDISKTAIQFMLTMVDNLVVIPKINELGSKGMPLPVTGQIQFQNTELTLAKDTVVIGTDLHYQPKVRG